MAEITTTQAFSDGDTVTATKLNNITANAAIQTEAITNRSAETTVDQANDLLLMYDASATALKKISLSNVIKAGTASNFPVTGNATVGGTLGVTGAITASSTVNGTTIPTSKTLVTTDDTQTLTGKTVNLSSNTLSGTLAQFNTACSNADFASLDGSETLTNKTLTSPAINTGTISGGTINNAVIGGTTAAAGSFTTLSATSPITTQAGTAASPAIQPTGDTNTGIFFPAADTIAFSEGGTESMRIDSSGNVGIGASSPSQKLDVNGGSAIRGTIFIGDGSSSVIRKLTANTPLNFANSGGNTEMTIDSSGNVGIGTTTPSTYGLFSAIGSSNGFQNITFVNSSTGASAVSRIQIGTDVSNGAGQILMYGSQHSSLPNVMDINNATNSSLRLLTNNTERLRIDSNGNVGIGTTSPTGIGSNYTTLDLRGSNGGGVGFGSTSAGQFAQIYAVNLDSSLRIQNTSASGFTQFTTNNTERLRITSGGVVRIGTTTELLSSANILEVSGTNGIGIKATGGAANPCMLAWNSAASGNNTFAIFYTETSPSSVGGIDFNRASTLTRYNTTSDATLKNIIGDSSGEESVSILKNTRIRDYTWKKDATNKVNVGVIAQELYEVFKGAVSEGGDIVSKDSDGNDITTYRPWGVDKTAFTFHLVAGWQAHEKFIQELKAENDSLKARITALEAA